MPNPTPKEFALKQFPQARAEHCLLGVDILDGNGYGIGSGATEEEAWADAAWLAGFKRGMRSKYPHARAIIIGVCVLMVTGFVWVCSILDRLPYNAAGIATVLVLFIVAMAALAFGGEQ